MLEIIEVNTGKLRKRFVLLPFSIYKGNEYWVPPLIRSEIKNIDSNRNPMAKDCETRYWIAVKDGITVGRIGAIIHNRYIEKTGEKFGRFTRAEFINDNEVVDKLFEEAEKWMKERGMTAIVGPLGFSNIDTQGMLVEGFNQLASIASVYHLSYYKDQMERLGFVKYMDWIEMELYIDNIPNKVIHVAEMVQQRYNLRVEAIRDKREIMYYAKEIFHLLNKAFENLFSFVDFGDEMIEEAVRSYMPGINPELIHVVFNQDNKIVGFIIPVPSLSVAMQKANGRIGLKAIIAIRKSRIKNDRVDLFLTGIDPEYQSKGVAGLLIAKTQAVMKRYGMNIVDTTGMLETNLKAIQSLKYYNGIQNKRKRCFIKYF